MNDEEKNISRKTWTQTAQSVNKIGYMDGASDGQHSVYQTNFDLGYEQGFNFGFDLGFHKALTIMKQQSNTNEPRDPRRINCQICVNVLTLQQNVGNLYNVQQEKNNLFKQIIT